MIAITDILKDRRFIEHGSVLEAQMKEKEYNLKSYKCYVAMNYEEFKQLLQVNCANIMLQRSIIGEYQIDKQNGPIIKQLYLYFMNDPACAWNLNAGLLFGGRVGCGKTMLMTAYLMITNEYSRKYTTIIHSKSLANEIKKNGLECLSRKPIMIDDLGREESEVKDWGSVVKPVVDIFSVRYENGARTYATTNFNYDRLITSYTEFTITRMQEMMTHVVFPGESRRLKNE